MTSRTVFLSVLAIIFHGVVMAAPMMVHCFLTIQTIFTFLLQLLGGFALERMRVEPLYVKPNVFANVDLDADEEISARQIPAEVPTTSVNGVIKEYGTRDLFDEEAIVARQIPAEVPTTSIDGVIRVYGTREVDEIIARQIPAEVPTTSENGIIRVYGTRDVTLA